jgi:hypothetical protein
VRAARAVLEAEALDLVAELRPATAAAEAPARPEPTTSTLYLRLFAGLTSFSSNLRFSHFCSIGPSGMRESSHHRLVHRVRDRPSRPVLGDQADRDHHVDDDQPEQACSNGPLHFPQALQEVRVAVVDIAPAKHLQVPDHVDDREQQQQQAGHRHHVLGTDGRSNITTKPIHAFVGCNHERNRTTTLRPDRLASK